MKRYLDVMERDYQTFIDNLGNTSTPNPALCLDIKQEVILWPFEVDSSLISEVLLFLCSMPRELCEKAGMIRDEMLSNNSNDTTAGATEDEVVDADARAVSVGVMACKEALEDLTRYIVMSKPWLRKFKDSIPVVTVFSTKKNEIVGEPVNRNILSTILPTYETSLVVLDKNGKLEPYLSLSDGREQNSASGKVVTEKHLLNLADVYSANTLVSGGKRYKADLLKTIVFSYRLHKEMMSLAGLLHALNPKKMVEFDVDRIFDFEIEEVVKRIMSAEDSPNAKIAIGSWS